MKSVQQVIFCLLVATGMYAQTDSLNMQVHASWDKATLPSDGSVKYNDLWGYVAPDGTEYAVLGNVDSIFFFDITDPANPVVIDSFYGGSRSLWRDFKTYGDYMYMCADENSEGLTIYDLSDLPDSVRLVDQMGDETAFFTRAHNIFIDTVSGRLYVAGSDSGAAREGLVILDIATDPENPSLLKEINLDTLQDDASNWYYIHDVFVRNDTAYCSHGNLGYFIWDCTDVEDIKLIGKYDNNAGNPGYNHSSWNSDDNNYAFVAYEVPRQIPIHVMKLDTVLDPADPPALLRFDTFNNPLLAPIMDNTPHNPFVKGDSLYISYYEDGVQVYDISDINNITRVGYYDTSDNTTYHGTTRVWGVYPFFPSGNIIASDTETGLYIMSMMDAVVPVEFGNIHAKILNEDNVLLTWETFSEINNAFFEIERSKDGITFEMIGETAANKDTEYLSTYSFADDQPFQGKNFYRIKQVDYDGRSSYSDMVIIFVTYGSKVVVFPNPNLGRTFNVNLNPELHDKSTIELIDAFGRNIYSSPVSAISDRGNGHFSFTLPTPISNGLYYLVIRNEMNVINHLPISVIGQ